MESRDINAAIECYSIALSLDPTNISDITIKCYKARAGLLEEQRLINANMVWLTTIVSPTLASGRKPVLCIR